MLHSFLHFFVLFTNPIYSSEFFLDLSNYNFSIDNQNINKISLNKEKIASVLKCLEALEDDEDVQHVYTNLQIDNNFEKKNLT